MQDAKHESSLERLAPLPRLITDRESLYFDLLAFISRNIQSPANQLDTLMVFTKQVHQTKAAAAKLTFGEQNFLRSLHAEEEPVKHFPKSSKQLLRFCSRILQILETSTSKSRVSIFNVCGSIGFEFTRFHKQLQKILDQDLIPIKELSRVILNYCQHKFEREFLKIQRFLIKLEAGYDTKLRDLYFKPNSDASSPDEKKVLSAGEGKHEHSDEQQIKKIPARRLLKSSLKKRQLNMKMHRQESVASQSRPKQTTANKMLRFYALLELNRKQFLEDYVYEQSKEQTHKKQIMSNLLERNKAVMQQITAFVRHSTSFIPLPPQKIKGRLNRRYEETKAQEEEGKVSPEETENSPLARNESVTSKISLKTSFVISKRKGSFVLESNGEKSELQFKGKDLDARRPIRTINSRRKSQNSRDSKSKRLFVVKAPMVFEDEVIPQAPIAQTQWLQMPLTTRAPMRKHEQMRLKKRNNPIPMENLMPPDSFLFP